jgi:SAM-dependent methyltransferase
MASSTIREARTARTRYALPNAGKEAGTRLAALSALYDQGTRRHLRERGVRRGWCCLEVGGGSGTIARWLAARVGSTGHVLATDIDPRFLEVRSFPNLEVRRHDIAADPLPEATFDLVHARLVLVHLPERDVALARMIAALKPGGWLLVEENDSFSMPPDPAISPGESRLSTHAAMMRLLEDRGVSRLFGRLLFGRLRAHGMENVGAEAQLLMLQPATVGVSMLRANFEQLRDELIAGHYVGERQFEDDVARLDDPGFMMPSSILWSVWGCRR